MNFNQFRCKSFYLLSSFILGCLVHTPSYAGMEVACSPHYDLASHQYTACSNLPALSPANDSQVNTALLLSDLGLAKIQPLKADTNLWSSIYGTVPFEASALLAATENKVNNQRLKFKPEDYVYDERCSTLKSGQAAFIQQITKNSAISAQEKQALISERQNIAQCDQNIPLLAVNPHWSVAARQYASYLNASIAFYNANFSTAAKIYTVLATVDDAWLKETSTYMLIRTSLNSAFTTAINPYGDLNLDAINQNLLKQFLDNISHYLKLYPNGQYVASARGLMRRGFWLTGRQDLLVNEIVWQIQHPKSKFYNLEMSTLPAEIDRRIFDSQNFNVKNLKDPFFLTIYNLMHMRENSSEHYKPISWVELNAQHAFFKSEPELFQYLQAAHLFYLQKKPQEALKYLTRPSTQHYLQNSQIFLKGMILDQIDPQAAQAYWNTQLNQAQSGDQRGLFEVALSPYLNNQQQVNAFIGKNAKISQPNLQLRFINQYANEASLQNILHAAESTEIQKSAAKYTLLSKALYYQNYALFNEFYPSLPKDAQQYQGYNNENQFKEHPPFQNFIWNGTSISPQLKCTDLFTLTKALAKNAHDPLLNMCMAEYIRSDKAYANDLFTDDLAHFKGSAFARGNVYKSLIKNQTKSELQAYALYRAIMCYAPSSTNECNDQDVAKSVRKQWFDQIKRDYPNTTWAKSLKYYW